MAQRAMPSLPFGPSMAARRGGFVQLPAGSRRIRKGDVPWDSKRRAMVALAGTLLLLSSSVFVLAQDQPRPENQIHVEISGFRNDQGQVLCAILSLAAGFPKKADKAVAHAQSAIANRHAVCEFPGLAPGAYAVSVIHDENSNGKLDTNFMGIPREGVGASNDAKGHLGPPKFDAAAFRFTGGRIELKITIKYL